MDERLIIPIELNTSHTYHIHFAETLASHLAHFSPAKIHAVFDENTIQYFKNSFPYDFSTVIPAGENHKTQASVDAIHQSLFANNANRNDRLITVGGGIVSDVGGYAAATYMRGMKWINYPTSLLAMVDATLGGKTGINTKFGKNLIGSFYHPEAVFLNPDTLQSLPENELLNGVGEMLKHGIIDDQSHFDAVITNIDAIMHRDTATLLPLIQQSLQIKKKIVSLDPHESHHRQVLNLGHTIAHALEKLSNYQISHGRAVIVGILIESYLAHSLGHLPNLTYSVIRNTLIDQIVQNPICQFFPNFSPEWLNDPDRLIDLLKHDKKNKASELIWALPAEFGAIKLIPLSPQDVRMLLVKFNAQERGHIFKP